MGLPNRVEFYFICCIMFDVVQFITQTGIGHEMTTEMVKEASDWFDKFLCESIKE